MEYHRFRLFLYLAVVPSALIALRASARRDLVQRAGVGVTAILLAAFLFAQTGFVGTPFRYDAAGPEPVGPKDKGPISGEGGRILVLADPASQNGSWHGLQLTGLGWFDYFRFHSDHTALEGLRGLFVEQSPTSRAVFELERIASSPDARPHWWAIRIAPESELYAETPEQVAARFRRLGVDRILARHDVAPVIRRLAVTPPQYLGDGFVWWELPEAVDGVYEDDGQPIELMAAPGTEHGGWHTDFVFALPRRGTAVLTKAFSSDWRVESGSATLEATADGLIRITGEGTIRLKHGPRIEEWLGLWIGLATWAGLATGSAWNLIRKRRHR